MREMITKISIATYASATEENTTYNAAPSIIPRNQSIFSYHEWILMPVMSKDEKLHPTIIPAAALAFLSRESCSSLIVDRRLDLSTTVQMLGLTTNCSYKKC